MSLHKHQVHNLQVYLPVHLLDFAEDSESVLGVGVKQPESMIFAIAVSVFAIQISYSMMVANEKVNYSLINLSTLSEFVFQGVEVGCANAELT